MWKFKIVLSKQIIFFNEQGETLNIWDIKKCFSSLLLSALGVSDSMWEGVTFNFEGHTLPPTSPDGSIHWCTHVYDFVSFSFLRLRLCCRTENHFPWFSMSRGGWTQGFVWKKLNGLKGISNRQSLFERENFTISCRAIRRRICSAFEQTNTEWIVSKAKDEIYLLTWKIEI